MPSLYEGLPITLVEAQASGLPCVISYVIPSGIDLTPCITRVSLKNFRREWAEKVLLSGKSKRASCKTDIAGKGYDIHTAAKRIAQIYEEFRGRKQ